MMDEHIKRADALEAIRKWCGDCGNGIEAILAVPTADVAPVMHGRWIDDHDYLKCPECGVMVKRDFTFFNVGDWNYCPNCGVEMDGDSDES